MTTVWIIARRERRTTGHGESSAITELATLGWSEDKYHPAFADEESARKYVSEKKLWGCIPIKLTVKETGNP